MFFVGLHSKINRSPHNSASAVSHDLESLVQTLLHGAGTQVVYILKSLKSVVPLKKNQSRVLEQYFSGVITDELLKRTNHPERFLEEPNMVLLRKFYKEPQISF